MNYDKVETGAGISGAGAVFYRYGW